MVSDDHEDFLAIRGTESCRYPTTFWGRVKNAWDVVRDLRIFPWPVRIQDTEYHGHSGFVRGATRIFKKVRHSYQPNRPINVVGHSLGGALALVVGLLLASNGFVVNIITFGAPRVFFSKITIPENCSITMYRNGRDIVTHVPLGRHPVKPVCIGKALCWHWNWHDHSIMRYVSAIQTREQV